MRKLGRLLIATVLLMAVIPGLAEERYKKWIFEFSVGGMDPADEIRSDAANLATFTDSSDVVFVRGDPRPDKLDRQVAQIDSEVRYDLRVGYGLAEWGWGEFILDGGVGYIDSSITGLEVAFQNCGEAADPFCLSKLRLKDFMLVPLPWHTLSVKTGDLKLVPVGLNGMVRFRPTKRLNPSAGIGAGYLFVDFDEHEQFTQVADFLDRSRGMSQRYNSSTGNFVFGPEKDIIRPSVDAPDTFFYEARVGMEWQLTPRWSLFLDARYEWADKSVEIKVDDDFKLGRSTPNGQSDILWPILGTPYRLTKPGPNGPDIYQQFPDDEGNWFVNGGELDYGGFSWGFGVRYSF